MRTERNAAVFAFAPEIAAVQARHAAELAAVKARHAAELATVQARHAAYASPSSLTDIISQTARDSSVDVARLEALARKAPAQ